MKTFFATGGPLAQYLSHYESRQDQLLMAQRIASFLAAPEAELAGTPDYSDVLVVEAETGIGKSLAYLVPAIDSGMRVVVSTATINLQDQLIEKEIPLLEKVLGREVSAVCVKGRQNYLCLYRWYQHRYSPQISLVGDEECEKVESWLEETECGDRAELDWLPDNSPLWPKISAHSYQCLGSDCPEWSNCLVNKLRKKAASARILVVNHHLYFSDLALRQRGFGEILPRHEAIIFDEAHHLEGVATTFFGTSFSQYQLYDLVSDISQQAEIDLEPEDGDRIVGTAVGVRQRVEGFVALFPPQRGRFSLAEFVRSNDNWAPEIQLVAESLKRLASALEKISRRHENWQVLADRAVELYQNLLFVGLLDQDMRSSSHVYWYEKRERAVSLSATPVNVSEDLRRSLYSTVPKIIMTSATLTTGGSFDYIRQRLGLSDDIEALQLKSPFDYGSRTVLYVPGLGFPEPSSPGYDEALCEQVERLLKITRGRALVLFTSFRGMDLVADYLTQKLNYPVFVQGTASRARLLERFRSQTDSVLLAVASFWEGVDIVGESLSGVIIDKLPFEVPTDPVVQARIQAIREDGGNPFFDFQIPRAVLSLRQGVGRLMRSASDGGLISVLDARLFTKRYGSVFLNSLPPSPVVRDMVEIKNFFGMLEENHS
ncbi:MAG: ATP-dependent DNA helicase [Desulfofustis sp.]|nr:ATP-dependent DNA helicase [Desulfofustis sp.]